MRDWKGSSQTYAFDAWNRTKAGHDIVHLMDLPRECSLIRTLHLRNWTRKFHGDQVFLVKSGTGGNQLQKAVAKKPCSYQNHKCRGNFADHQKATESLAGGRTSVTARPSAQRLLRSSPTRAPGGEQPERKRHRHSCG